MYSIIIVFPKLEDGKSIKGVLVRNGYDVQAVCTTGAQAVNMANQLDSGLIICGYRFPDMQYSELYDYLPKGFEMLLVASPAKLETCLNHSIICVGMPLKTRELLQTLEMMTFQYRRRRKKEKEKQKAKPRSDKDRATIQKAKMVLMDRNNMSEEEAHRYIQKTSMDSGTNMVETAEMILSMMIS